MIKKPNVYNIKPNWKKDTGTPTIRTFEKTTTEFNRLLNYARNWVPMLDNNWMPLLDKEGKPRTSPVYLKYKLCFDLDYTRDQIYDVYRDRVDPDEKIQLSHTLYEINKIIENRLFEVGLTKKADSSIVRLWLTANHKRVTDRTKNENENKNKLSDEEQKKVDELLKQNM